MRASWIGVILLTASLTVGASTLAAAPGDEPAKRTNPPRPVLPDPPKGPIGHGIVYQADGTPLVGGQVWACFGFGMTHGGDPVRVIETKTDANGMFQCDPPAGDTSRYVQVLVRDGQGNYATRQRHWSPRDPYISRLVLEEEKYYKVRVVNENDQPQSGAVVHPMGVFGTRLAATTDASGEATVLATFSNEGLLANLPGKGIAGRDIMPYPRFGRWQDLETIELKLEDATRREVVVQDIDGTPLEGADVEVISLSGVYTPMNSCWTFQTDQQGRAAFDLPVLNGGLVAIDRPGYQRVRVRFQPDYQRTGKIETRRDVTLPELITLRGRVQIDPAVKVPAGHSPRVSVSYSGRTRYNDYVRGNGTIGDGSGEFEIQVPVESYLSLTANQAGLQGDPVFLTVHRGQPPEQIQLTIQPEATIRGQVLVAHTEQPTAKRTVKVFQTSPDWARRMKDYFQQHPLPDTELLPRHWFPPKDRTLECDELGKFEFKTPAGRYGIQEAASKDGTEVIVEPGETQDVIVWKDWGVK